MDPYYFIPLQPTQQVWLRNSNPTTFVGQDGLPRDRTPFVQYNRRQMTPQPMYRRTRYGFSSPPPAIAATQPKKKKNIGFNENVQIQYIPPKEVEQQRGLLAAVRIPPLPQSTSSLKPSDTALATEPNVRARARAVAVFEKLPTLSDCDEVFDDSAEQYNQCAKYYNNPDLLQDCASENDLQNKLNCIVRKSYRYIAAPASGFASVPNILR